RPVGVRTAGYLPVRSLVGAVLQVFRAEMHIVADIEIEKPIAIQIAEGAACLPSPVAYPRRPGHVGERPVAVVVVQRADPVSGDEQVYVAVVVITPRAAADPEALASQTCLPGDLGKRAVAVVVVQRAARLSGKEQVEPAIIIVVQKGAPAAGRLQDGERP